MNDGSGAIKVSLRQADGAFFPIFRVGDPDTRNLVIIPAAEGQEEVDIKFFHHDSDESKPREIGILRFPELPDEGTERELQLDAVIGSTGLLTVTLRHAETGRVERLEMELPEERFENEAEVPRTGGWRNGPVRWVLGLLFVIGALALVFWLTKTVTDWGKEDPAPVPVSVEVTAHPGSPV